MASQMSAGDAPQGVQSNLEQERDRWFTTLEAVRRRFEAEKETLKSKLNHDQQSTCRDLEEQARFAESQNLPRQVLELFQNYQAEIRTRRLAECKQNFDLAMQDLSKHEKDVYHKHHMEFPLPTTLLGRGAATNPSNSSTALANRPQTSALHTQAAHNVPPASRTTNPVTNNISSAPMPTQQNQHQWQGYSQAPRHHSPRMSGTMNQPNRSVNQAADGNSRMLPSNGRTPLLGNGMPSSNPNLTSAPNHGSSAGSPRSMSHSVDVMRGGRVPIPPMTQAAHILRDERSNITRNGVHLQSVRPEDYARQAQLEVHRQLKRKSDSTELSHYHDLDAKRARTATPQSMAPFSIKFQEIYQDGKAEFKHTIVKYEDIFYILKCDEHGVHFKQNALAAAAKHLHGASHGHLKKEHRLAIQKLGFHVTDCTDELAKMNNEVVQKAFESGYKPLNQLHGPKSGGKRHSSGHEFFKVSSDLSFTPQPQPVDKPEPKPQDVTKYITNPEAGELYQARWPKSNKMYVVMVLGWTDLSMCGWAEKFSDLALYKERPRPSCFKFSPEGIAGWAEGYGDGEPRVLSREVPVMWFETNGKNRLGWVNVQLLRPFLLDDPNRPANPNHTSNRARQLYAEIRGFNSFEDMLLGNKRSEPAATEGHVPADIEAPSQLPSSASESESSQDVEMYDFVGNPPKVDDSEDEDYVEATGRRKGSDEEMADDEPSTPQPLRRSTQEVRPTSRLSDSTWGLARTGAAAGTRSSRKDEVDMKDAAQETPSKSRVSTEAKESNDLVANGSTTEINLGTSRNNDVEEPENTSTTNESAASRDRRREGGSRDETISVAPNSTAGQVERSGASKSPSLENEVSKPSPKLQLANLLNSTGPDTSKEKLSPTRPESSSTSTKLVEARRPLPSQAGQTESRRHPLPSHLTAQGRRSAQTQATNLPSPVEKPIETNKVTSRHSSPVNGIHRPPSQSKHSTEISGIEAMLSPKLSVNGDDSSKQPSPTLSMKGINEATSTETRRSGSADSSTRDPRMSISNALGDHEREAAARRAAQQLNGASGQMPSNGVSSDNSTPRVMTHVSLANDDRWRAVRSSESPRFASANIRSPLVDRSGAASPVQGYKKEADGFSIDVASFSEGDKSWTHPDKLLHFDVEDESRGVARSRAADGLEAKVDAQQVKAAKMDKKTWTVTLVLKTEDGESLEQRFGFKSNSITGSSRGAQPQATKFYRWVTAKNAAIEHIE
ncbi:uncharacterized protein CTRU02_210449 [Colletotrichum truncatum]|uniref:Uncharacterized protein n=1 Tax=Colletotrichum truncatum TaxID=5467 RepID=A0ACC3YP30_COLTU|nr:uncharacterized protein CTRU02_13950 [Colletotrichum truncatum]KAF6782793.1 hypothetical protein CTRU02_13950 [Colletotrichum truncatum]